MPRDHDSALGFLYGRLNYERTGMPRIPAELRLGRMRRLLRRLGDPQDGLRILHIAGTKGKGSTASMLASALSASGVKTGLFCSPHLHRLEERFRIDGREATPEELVDLVEAVRPAVEHFDSDRTHHRHRGPTFFEITTAMGLLHFAREDVGAVCLEVGMGGRLDSTNCVRPAVSAITSISFDHTKQLGSTLGAIAGEKAGILKRGRPAVSGVGADTPDARAAIERVARQRRCRLFQIGDDFGARYHRPEPPLHRPEAGRVSVSTWRTDWGTLPLPLIGPHQAPNAAVALATLDALADAGGPVVTRDDVIRGWSRLRWPARVEVFEGPPRVVIDGAHNVAAAEALAESLRECFPPGPRLLVFGTTRDKDLTGQLRQLAPHFDRFVATRYVENPRAVPPEEVARALAEIAPGRPVETAPAPSEALALARQRCETDGLIVVTGSLFLAGEARAALGVSGETRMY